MKAPHAAFWWGMGGGGVRGGGGSAGSHGGGGRDGERGGRPGAPPDPARVAGRAGEGVHASRGTLAGGAGGGSAPLDPARVAIYIRWSTEDQAAGTTLEIQREACRHYVLSQGWQLRDDLCFVDEGWSGGMLARPGMAALRRLVAAGEVACVVVYKIDRLSRNLVDAVQLVLREWDGRCHLKSVREPIDTTTDLGRMIFGILAMFADFERTAIRDRTQAGKVQRIRGGEQMHARPAFGYAPHPSARGRWVARPEEAALVREMFELAAAGVPVGTLVRRLNAAGLRTRAGREWSARSALWILHNRTYLGEVVYGRTSLRAADDGSGRRVRVTNAAPRVAGPTDAAPALVTAGTFARAQAEMAAHRVRRAAAGSRAEASPHLLTGLARCPCGAAMVYKAAARGKRAGGVAAPGAAAGPAGGYYVCSRTRRGTCARRGHVPAAPTEALVARCLLQRLAARVIPADIVADALAPLRSERRALAAAIAAARRTLRRLGGAVQAGPVAVPGGVTTPAAAGSGQAAPPVDAAKAAGGPASPARGRARRQATPRVDVAREGRPPGDAGPDAWAATSRQQATARAEAARISQLLARLAELDACLAEVPDALAQMGTHGAWDALVPRQRREVLRVALVGPIVLRRDRGDTVTIAIPWAL